MKEYDGWGGQRCSHFEVASKVVLLVPLDFVMVRITQWALVSLVVRSWVSQDWGAAASDVLNICFP